MACRLVGAKAIFWTNAGILLVGPLETNFSEILVGIQAFSLKKMHLKMSSAEWHPFCLGLNVLMMGFVCAKSYNIHNLRQGLKLLPRDANCYFLRWFGTNHALCLTLFKDLSTRSRHLMHWKVIASHRLLWDVFTYPWLGYLLLEPKVLCHHWIIIRAGAST